MAINTHSYPERFISFLYASRETLFEEQQSLNKNWLGYVTVGTDLLLCAALLIVGVVGQLDVIAGPVIDGSAIGLGSGSLLLQLAPGKFKERKFTLLIGGSVALLTLVLGVLGLTAILSSYPISSALSLVGIFCLHVKIYQMITVCI